MASSYAAQCATIGLLKPWPMCSFHLNTTSTSVANIQQRYSYQDY